MDRDLLEARCERDVYRVALEQIAELDTSNINSGVAANAIAQVALGILANGIAELDKVEVAALDG